MAGYKISELESQADKKSWFIELDEPHEFHEYEDTFRTKYLIASYASSNDAPIDWPAEIILWNATKTKHLASDISLSYGKAEETLPYEAFAINEHNLLSKEDIASGQKLAPEQLLHVALDWLEIELGQKETLSKEATPAPSTAQSTQPQEQPSQIDAANHQPTIPITNIENTTPSRSEQKTTTPAASTVNSEVTTSQTDNGGKATANPSTNSDEISQDKVELVFKSSDVHPFIEKNTGAQKAMCTMGDGYVVSLFMKTEHLLAQQAGQDVTFEFEPTQSIKMFGDLKHQNLPLQVLNVKELRNSLIDRYASELTTEQLEPVDSKQTEPIQEHTEVKTESVAPSTDEQNFKLKIAELLISGADEQAIIDFVGNYASGLAINKQTNVVQETPKEETTEQTEASDLNDGKTVEKELLYRIESTFAGVGEDKQINTIEDVVTYNEATNTFLLRSYINGNVLSEKELNLNQVNEIYKQSNGAPITGTNWESNEDAETILRSAEEKAAKQSAEDRPNPNVSANAMLEQMSTHKVQTSATAKQEEQGQTYKP